MVLAPALVLVPFSAALIGLLSGRLPAVTAVLGATVSAGLAIVLAVNTGEGVTEAWVPFTPTGGIPIVLGARIDTTAATVAVMVTLVAFAVQVFSAGSMRGGPRYRSYAALISLFTAAMLAVVLASDLMLLYVGWEVMGVCSYLLIGHRWEDRTTTAAALKAFLMTRVGDIGLLLGIIVLGLGAGSFRITAVLAAVPGMSRATLTVGALLLVLGVVAKSGQFPLHAWLPDAMVGPAPVSALIHAATMVAAGVYLVLRLYPVFLAAPAALTALGVLATVTMLGAALAALGAPDLKRVLAYSTISQLALMFGALAVGGAPGIHPSAGPAAATTHLLSHAAFKALLFLAAGVVLVATSETRLARIGGLRAAMPITFGAATVGFGALAALPPTSGFVSKDGVLDVLWHAPGPLATCLLGSALLTTAVTGAYATRTWLRVFFGPAEGGSSTRMPPLLSVPLVALASATLLLGVFWLGTRPVPVDPDVAMTGTGFALAGVLVAYVGWRRAPAWSPPVLLASGFGTDDLYERTVVPAVLRMAAGVVGTDGALGAVVRGTGRAAASGGSLLRRSQTGNPQLYVTVMLATVVLVAVGTATLR